MNKVINENLRLELINESHAEELFSLTEKNRSYLRDWLPWVDSTQTVTDTLEFITTSQKQYESNRGFQFAILYKNNLAGMIGLVSIDNFCKKTEIGYWLGEQYTGNGIMTMACKTLIDHCFDDLNINRITIRCHPDNKASIGIPEKLNFKKEGILVQDTYLNEKFENSFLFAMLKAEWKDLKISKG